jgi:UDP-N-acetylmuramoyl-tripeptide--D-alanyl-D-alanine ligase
MRFTLDDLAAAAGARAHGAASLSGVAVDSRQVAPGDLFVAIRGARVDGHDFAREAFARGAKALLGERLPADLPPETPSVLVEKPVEALQRLAAALKRAAGFRLAAITGSAGKTTTKDFAAAMLARRLEVEKTPGNQNSQIGFAMSIVNLRRTPEWMVGEMGLSEKGDLSRLSRAFEPDVAAILLVAAAHLQYFASVDAIADAKAEILEGLKPGGAFVANADDPRVAALAARHRGRLRVVGFGRFESSPGADVTARDVVAEEGGSRFRLSTPAGEAPVRLPVVGPHQVMNFLAAAAIAFVVGLTPSDCAEAAGELRAAAHRGEWRRHASGARLYDDSYNANPSSMRAALDTLAAVPARRRIAVLGDMLELGPDEERWHLEAGRSVPGRADLLVCVGALARALGEGAAEAGLPRAAIRHAASADEAAPMLAGILAEGDVALFKASRGIGLDRAVAALTASRA